ncbi:MAG: DUF58 domain-containing protein [Cumulibacter sp.]
MASHTKRRSRRQSAGTTFTTRGSSVLAAALAAGAGSFALGETDLLRVAIVLIIVCVLTWLCALLLRAKIRTRYFLDPAEASVDTSVNVAVNAQITRLMQPAALVCHARTGAGLTSTAHLSVPGAAAGGGVRLDFSTKVTARGSHKLGPLEVTIHDPLGLVSTRYSGSTHATILGLPRHYRVHPGWLRSIGAVPRTANTALEEGLAGQPDVGVRDYHPEDGMRRIHWRSSARTGRLMTRLERPESETAATIAFESRAQLHDERTFERTLEIVASLGVELLENGWGLRVIDSTGPRRPPTGAWHRDSLLRFLALAHPMRDGGAPPLPPAATPMILVTTDPQQHRPQQRAQTFLVPLAATKAEPTPGLTMMPRGGSIAAVLAEPPIAGASA